MMTTAHAQTFQPAKWLSRLSTSLAGLLLFSSAALAHNVDTSSIVQIRQNGGIATNLKPGVDATIRLTFRNEGKNNAVVGFNNPGQCNAGYPTDGSIRGPEYSNAPFNENPDVFIQTTAIPPQFEISGPLPANCVNQGAGTVDGVAGTVVQCTVTQPAGLPNGKLAPGLESAAPVDIPVTVRGTVGNNIQIPNVLSYPLQTQQQIGSCNNPANDAAPKAQYTLVATTGQALSGFVYLDQNNNGIKDATEPVLPNVALTLSGTSYGGNAVAGGGDDRALTAADGLAATTDANGFYSFTIVNPGTYTVTEQNAQPVYNTVTTINGKTTAGTVTIGTPGTAVALNVTPSAIANIIMLTNGASPNNNFGELLPGSIGGKVFLDNNNDGILNGADAGIAGVAITLTGTNDLGNPINATTNTLANGSYTFNGLRPGTYLITEGAQPANTINGFANAGTIDGVAVGTVNNGAVVTPTGTGRIDNIVLLAGKNSINNNFGETVLSSISGRVFLDNNNDGVFNGVDSGLVVPLTLTGIDDLGATVNTVINSNADGTYTFSNLRPSNGAGYTVTEGAQPANTQNGKTNAGTIDGVSKGNATPVVTTPSAIAGIVLIGGKAAINNDFAEIPTTGVISGKIFVDNNNDGLQGQGEANLPGYIVTLTGTDSNGQPVSKQVTTLADGTYAFTGLLPGNYQVSYQPLAQDNYRNGRSVPGSLGGTASNSTTLSAITLTAGNLNSSANNFTRVGKASISGKVFLDLNNNGVLDSTTGDSALAGITINLTGTDNNGQAVNKTTTTDSTGAYQFLGLESGTYTVTEPSQPAGTQNGVTKVGTVNGVAKGTATASTVTPSAISNVVLTIGDASINNDFAEYVGATLNGSVWYDSGATRGILDGGDRGLSGWQVEVLDPTKPAGQQLVTTATTGADGKYSIPGLAPGVIYDVQFREPGSRVVYGKPVNGESGTNKYSCNAATLTATSNGPATSGQQSSCVKSDGSALRVVLLPGSNLLEQSLPVDPSGIIYDSVTRTPVAGATVTLTPVGSCAGYNPSQHLINASSYNLSGNSASMTTGTNGFYQYLFSGAAPASCQFQLVVAAPPGYVSPSTIIAPVNGVLATPAAPGNYLVQPQANPPSAGQATTYYLLVNSGSGTQSILNNHIPLDPTQPAGFTVTKIGSAQSVELGDSLTYTVRVRLANGIVLPNVSVTDTLPAGFKYIKGTSRRLVNGVATVLADPVGDVGPVLTFNLGAIPQNGDVTFSYRVRVGVGAQQGDGINRAQASAGTIRSNVAQFKVTVTGGVFTQDACVLGKIFVDCNNNHIQDPEELGIPGVRLYIEDGAYLISDVEGKYSICGLTPRTHAIKVDKTTLPFGSRLTTSSNRNAGDANSLFMDLKNGELHRADFIEGSCSNTILEQVKARRANGETRAPQTERKIGNGFTFSSKPAAYPQQGTDSANQRAVKPRYPDIQCGPKDDSNAQCNTPVPQLQINPPSTQGGAHAQ